LDTETTRSLEALRAQIVEIDRELVETINRRLEIVQQIWAHKREHGLGDVDPDRERWLHEHLAASNRGPLSAEGLERIYAELLALTKREMGS
jgi:3-deoxy-7-phosphoheptulonate synthase / chorismate mutase